METPQDEPAGTSPLDLFIKDGIIKPLIINGVESGYILNPDLVTDHPEVLLKAIKDVLAKHGFDQSQDQVITSTKRKK